MKLICTSCLFEISNGAMNMKYDMQVDHKHCFKLCAKYLCTSTIDSMMMMI
jgi:hypothetical protein